MIDSVNVKQRNREQEGTNDQEEEDNLDDEEERYNNDENGFDEKKTNIKENMM